MRSMERYPKAAVERAMKVQEVVLRAMTRKITWWQAAEILGLSDRHLRRIRERCQQFGYESLFDLRRGGRGLCAPLGAEKLSRLALPDGVIAACRAG